MAFSTIGKSNPTWSLERYTSFSIFWYTDLKLQFNFFFLFLTSPEKTFRLFSMFITSFWMKFYFLMIFNQIKIYSIQIIYWSNFTVVLSFPLERIAVKYKFQFIADEDDILNRTTLGFWAGHRNSKIRVILARVWENDTELDISNNRINRATGHLVYQKRFYRTKFCICPGGSQVNSARIADSIHYGCVPGESLTLFLVI